MTLQTVVDNEYVTVWVDEAQGLIHHQMHKPCFREVFRTALSAGVDAMRATGATKWLSDDRNNGALSPEDEAWAKTVWFPASKEAGWTHWALVQPALVVGQMNMKRFTDVYAAKGITVRVFSDPDAAASWLQAI